MRRGLCILLLAVLFPVAAQGAISVSLISGGASQSNANGTGYTTDSITPPDNQLIIAFIASSANDAATVAPTLSGNGLTWVQIATETGTIVGNERRITAFRALGDASAGAVTITFSSSQDGCAWGFLTASGTDISGTNGSGAIVQNPINSHDTNDATSLTVTMSTFADATNNALVIGVVGGSNEAMTSEAGLTELFDVTHSARNMNMSGAWRTGGADLTPTISWTTLTYAAGIALELREPQAGTRRIMLVQ